MKPLTREWVQKAEGDFSTARRELRARISPNFDAVCFHSQQVAEKYLKAFLQQNDASIPKTHVLADLLALCANVDGSFAILRPDLDILEGFAIQFRYPGQNANKADAKSAYQSARVVREFIQKQLS